MKESPQNSPFVAVVLATYKPSARFLNEQLESLVAQSHKHWLCILSDDDSGPETVELLQSWCRRDRRFRLVQGRRVGVYHNFERGLGQVPENADLIAYSDQDDR